ncbi:hypothetical protein Patl1_25222 [Pistacia atlantica]|uniref:Uncharacterized protein n=1 Tax=Pistacia atlantica TaxID=434234 RepID=A0ACC1AZW6_9ROSI|nr:hypothetical protein Patl1_25222 [Pistacia atlantica]
MEANTKVVSENVELKKEEVKKKNKRNKKKGNKNNNNDNIKNKEAALVDPANGDVINAAADVLTTNDSSGRIKKKNNTRIQVSNTKKPFIFYLNLAKMDRRNGRNLSDLIAIILVVVVLLQSYIKQNDNVELSALGMAIPTVVTIAEILKRDGLVNNKEVKISTLDSKEDHRGSFIQKPKIQIILAKAESMVKTITAGDAATAPQVESDKQA